MAKHLKIAAKAAPTDAELISGEVRISQELVFRGSLQPRFLVGRLQRIRSAMILWERLQPRLLSA